MRIYDLIQKKKTGQELTTEEIKFVVSGFTCGDIPDYQMSALLMAICLKGMTKRETADLTLAMAYSGDVTDLSRIPGIKVDKHSTGGVGDKTTLIISPIVASLGVPIAKMSGRGLGHTGGTVDKLESIPGLKTAFSAEDFVDTVIKHGICVAGQSGNLAPADKKMYALRDVTATIDSIPLIAASIMSKKIAAGADCILLDVKTGSGAFMKTLDDSIALAKAMVEIGEAVGRQTIALITDMEIPLGNNIGNSLEIIEAVNTLNGKGPKDLYDVCVELAAVMLELGGISGDHKNLAARAVASGKALESLCVMVKAQGGDESYIRDTGKFSKAAYCMELEAGADGYISRLDAEGCGIASVMLGGGREKAGETVDFAAGIVFAKKAGDYVRAGETVATMYSNVKEKMHDASERLRSCFEYSETAPVSKPLIYAKVSKSGVEMYSR